MSTTNNEWDGGSEITSNWFKFSKVGDLIKGTLVNRRFQKANLPGYQDQWIYEIKKEDGTYNVSVSANKKGTCDRLNKCQIGEIVGILFEKEGPKVPGKFAAKYLAVKTFGMDDTYLSGGLNMKSPSVDDDAPPFLG